MEKSGISWRRLGLSVIGAAALATSTVAPTVAATPRAHTAAHAASKAHAGIPVRCKTRNKASGTIKWSDWQFPDTLNVYQTNASVTQETLDSLIEGLVYFDQNGKVRPDMLAALPSVKNGGFQNGGKTVVVNLKKGMQWSNGVEITAADVKFGFAMESYAPSGGTPLCAGTCDVISRVDTKGKYQVIFHLKRVDAPFITNDLPTAWPQTWANAWTKGDFKAAYNKLVLDPTFNFESADYPTNGAYQVSAFNKNDRIGLTPMKHYSILSCGAKVQNLIFSFFSSKPGMLAAAASGQTDSTTDYSLADLPQLQQHAGAFKVHNDPGFLIEHLTFNDDATYNGQKNPLSDVRVRQALSLALDKYGLIESALGMNRATAQGIIAWTPLILTKKLVQPFADKKLVGQWDPIAKKYLTSTGSGQALADAKQLLSQAGYPNGGFTLDGWTTQGNPVRVAQFNIVLASWAKVGVTFKENFMPAGTFFGDYDHGSPLHTGKYQVAMYADVGYPDPAGFKTSMVSTFIDREKSVHNAINQNYGGIKDSTIDTDFAKGAASIDSKVRQKYYSQMQVEMNQKAYWVPLFYRGSINTDDGHIAKYHSNPTNEGEEWNTWEWAYHS